VSVKSILNLNSSKDDMTCNEQQHTVGPRIRVGSILEVLWNIDDDEIWWKATVSRILGDDGLVDIIYDPAPELGYPDAERASVTIDRDGCMKEDDKVMNWRFQGEDRVYGCQEECEEGCEDDPSVPAIEHIRRELSQVIEGRPAVEKRILASQVSDALEMFSNEVSNALQGLGKGEEVNDRVAQEIISRLTRAISSPSADSPKSY
jgi:hypothetical protein